MKIAEAWLVLLLALVGGPGCQDTAGAIADAAADVGSANLDDGSLESSTELNLSVLDDRSATNLRERLLREHLDGMFDPVVLDDPVALLRLIRAAAQDSAHRVAAKQSLRCRLYEYFWDRRSMPEPPRP
jgi:phosphatidylserine/phosphatidylglycerophosphate/cardiolipin synthase-like enzyme